MHKLSVLLLSLFVCFAFSIARMNAQTVTPIPVIDEFDMVDPHGFDWMLAYQGKSTADFGKDPHFADLEKRVIAEPKVQQDFDGPGTHVLLRDKFLDVLSGSGGGPSSPDPVQVRLGRYISAASCRGEKCESGAFLWADAANGMALCVLIHPPTPDLPSKGPAMIVYSRQLKMTMKIVKEASLPEQFWYDFRDWAYNKHLPTGMTQRYVNGYNAIQVLLHDEEMCQSAWTTRDAETCNQDAQDTANADMQALLAQIRSLPAEQDAATQALLQQSDEVWKNYRDKACKAAFNQMAGGTGAPVMEGDCSVRLTKAYVRELQADYYMMLFD